MTTQSIECLTVSVPKARMKSFIRFALTVAIALTVAGIAFRIDYRGAVGQIRWVRGWKKAGLWARENLPQEYRIAVAPIGAIGYYSNHYIIDMMGLTDFEIAHFGQIDPSEGPGHQKSYIELVIRRKPEIVLGQAVLFDHYPTVQETVSRSARKALKKMYRLPEFQKLYKYKVARVGQTYIPYWIDRSLEQVSNSRQDNESAAAAYVPNYGRNN